MGIAGRRERAARAREAAVRNPGKGIRRRASPPRLGCQDPGGRLVETGPRPREAGWGPPTPAGAPRSEARQRGPAGRRGARRSGGCWEAQGREPARRTRRGRGGRGPRSCAGTWDPAPCGGSEAELRCAAGRAAPPPPAGLSLSLCSAGRAGEKRVQAAKCPWARGNARVGSLRGPWDPVRTRTTPPLRPTTRLLPSEVHWMKPGLGRVPEPTNE